MYSAKFYCDISKNCLPLILMVLKYCNITIYYNSEYQLKLLPTHFHLDNIPNAKNARLVFVCL